MSETTSKVYTFCPVCGGRFPFESIQSHLQLHSKDDLINLLISKPCEKKQVRKSHSSTNNSPKHHESIVGLISCNENESSYIFPNETIGKLNASENNLTPIEEVTLMGCDMESSSTSFQTLHPVELILLSEDMKDEIRTERDNEANQKPCTSLESCDKYPNWSVPIPEYTISSVHSNQSQSLFNYENSGSPRLHFSKVLDSQSSIKRTKIDMIGSQHNSMDLMTDEEIPPRGEISEYEESNQSEEMNKISARRDAFTPKKLSPIIIEVFKQSKRAVSLKKQEKQKSSSSPRKSKNLKKELISSVEDQHKCPVEACLKVGSIFELAQHQEREHPLSPYVPLLDKKTKKLKSKSPTLSKPSTSQLEISKPDEKPSITQIKKAERGPKEKFGKGSNEYHCLYCDFFSSKKKILHSHMTQLHPELPENPENYECRLCGKLFTKRINWTKHMHIHGGKKFTCQCGKAFITAFKLAEHSRVHTRDYPFQCTECQRSFRTPSLHKYHMLKTHPKEGDPVLKKVKHEYQCSVCLKILNSKRTLLRHVELHFETSEKKCDICSEKYTKKSALVRHMRISHASESDLGDVKECEICKKKLHPNSMKIHMRIHNDEKPFSCYICSKKFRTAANLSSHAWSHTNAEKPFKCLKCSKTFLSQKNLECHALSHRRNKINFACNECGVRFTSRVNLKRHAQEHFSEKKHECKVCHKKFHRTYYLKEHMRVHSNEKPYSCTVCGKGSATRSNHRAHQKIHDPRDTSAQEG